MTTAERELDQNTNFDWNRIQESGQEVEPLFGPGYTGLVNLGNSCYLASTMQVVFSTQSFHSRYYLSQSLKAAFETAPADPTVDLNMQLNKEEYINRRKDTGERKVTKEREETKGRMRGSSGPDRSLLCFDGWVTFNQLDCQIAGLLLSLVYSSGFDNNPFNTFKLYGRTKLAHGMLSGKYSFPASEKIDIANAAAPMSSSKQEGIPPRMFKAVIAASHPEFSSMRQQGWERKDRYREKKGGKGASETKAAKIDNFSKSNPYIENLVELGILVYTSRRVIKNAILCNDALEFFLHLLDQVERVNAGHPELDPSRSFKFGIEERLFCPSGKVAYNRRGDYILSLNIPLHEATNKGAKIATQRSTSRGTKISTSSSITHLLLSISSSSRSGDEIVRPRVPLEACLASFSAPEEVHGFYSTALKTKTTAVKTAGLTSFPDYLVLHMRKFVMEEGWVPKKAWYLSYVYIDVPDIIDISHMRSRGIQPGEELLPEAVDEGKVESEKLLANEEIVAQLVSMGFNHLHCQKAAINTSNAGVEEAMNWLLSHMDDPDIDFPISQEAENAEALSFVDQSKVDTLISFGFQEDISRRALRASGGDIERKQLIAIFSNPDAASSSDMDATTSSTPTADAGLPDGGGRYRLIGLVSHIGTSTQCGHYVAHIYKDGRWVIFNDDKVGASINPPKDMGYLYFFERLSS
uniref:Ubiquitin carboxyl-terminal hydrolase n=1 Tax=Vitis vinifera TaxID=29760 RepID=A5C9N1_VITVI|nr:hypothetical protein VITISV_025191 [Vitis vinifera]